MRTSEKIRKYTWDEGVPSAYDIPDNDILDSVVRPKWRVGATAESFTMAMKATSWADRQKAKQTGDAVVDYKISQANWEKYGKFAIVQNSVNGRWYVVVWMQHWARPHVMGVIAHNPKSPARAHKTVKQALVSVHTEYPNTYQVAGKEAALMAASAAHEIEGFVFKKAAFIDKRHNVRPEVRGK